MKKILTREQAQTSKDRAARFVENVLNDADKAQAIEDESLDEWVDRKKITLTNPTSRRKCPLIHEGARRQKNMAKNAKKSLADQLEDLKAENEDLRAENDDLSDRLDQIDDILGGDEDEDDAAADDDEGDDDEGDDQD